MALIKCKECGKKVSNKAEVCVGCGYPIKLKKGSSTIEMTKKSLKLQLFISKYTMWLSVIIAFVFMMIIDEMTIVEEKYHNYFTYTLIAMGVNIFWYFLTKIRIWWNHD